MDKKEMKNKDDCKICCGCGGCEDYDDRKELNSLFEMYEYGQPAEKPSGGKIPGTGQKNGKKE